MPSRLRHYSQAEQLCKKLLRLHRKAFDGHDRMAMLREAQGRFQEAARHYSKVLEMIEKDPTGTDHETVQYVTEKRDHALARGRAFPHSCTPTTTGAR